MPGFWKKCEWCDGKKRVLDVIFRSYVYCLQCAGLGETWVEVDEHKDGIEDRPE